MIIRHKILLDSNAISIVQDTLLFLVFISISALILSPAVIQTTSSYFHHEYLTERHVQESLQTVLSTTKKDFTYCTGVNIIPLAESLGVNISSSHRIYASITNNILIKQQSHKTIAQLLTEQLATQYRMTINDSTVYLNPFSGDASEQLTQVLTTELSLLLPTNVRYNFTAIWQPIHNIPFGGKITIGEPIPHTVSTFTSHQKLSMPFLPCIIIDNDSYCYSSYHLKKDTAPFIQDICSIRNIFQLQDQYKNKINANISYLIRENISSYLEDILINGVRTKYNLLVNPGLFNVLFTYLFSFRSFKLTGNTIIDEPSNIIGSMNSYFKSLKTINGSDSFTNISIHIESHFDKKITDQIEGLVLSTPSDFVIFIKQNLLQQIRPIIESLSYKLSFYFLSTQQPLDFVDKIIDDVFDHLSLTSASLSLTVWRG